MGEMGRLWAAEAGLTAAYPLAVEQSRSGTQG